MACGDEESGVVFPPFPPCSEREEPPPSSDGGGVSSPSGADLGSVPLAPHTLPEGQRNRASAVISSLCHCAREPSGSEQCMLGAEEGGFLTRGPVSCRRDL
ncbi:hypothetical protein AAFF_G00318000 [Aldrovandia affinis]|uniref:Uncharacterized protein n=1 Tax=Aldrovandia affinis TaxID=143900 RepID=A0AAD7R707_9TELE|nr:hypothetical protein AAFF_G00318000 [Aldrovandia affinis]